MTPEGKLGLSVGWGDQYEATDGGEGIPITSLANGTYWLQGVVDPYHYFQESNASNDITDTKLQIEGNTVKVLEQVQPEVGAADRDADEPDGRRHDLGLGRAERDRDGAVGDQVGAVPARRPTDRHPRHRPALHDQLGDDERHARQALPQRAGDRQRRLRRHGGGRARDRGRQARARWRSRTS